MKEVACAVCGAVYRFAPADIPPAGKTLTCAKCKARVIVPGSGAPVMAGGAGDVIDLADLPAARRIPVPPQVARSSDGIDLPMPTLNTEDLGLELPPPKRASGDDALTLDSIDLLSPLTAGTAKPAPPAVGGEPIEMPGIGITDLPTPKRSVGGDLLGDLPAPKRSPAPAADLSDLPAPKRPSTGDVSDLPAPKRASSIPDVSDLPAPKRAAVPGGVPPRPPGAPAAPKPPLKPPVTPPSAAAKPPAKPAAPGALFDDLPAPKHSHSASIELQLPTVAPPPPTRTVGGLGDPGPAPAPLGKGGGVTAPSAGARAPTLDLDGLDLAPPAAGGLELEPAVASARQADYGAPAVSRTHTSTNPPPLELGVDADALPGLDLPAPNAPGGARTGGGVVSFKAPGGPSSDGPRAGGGLGDLDLAGPAGPVRTGGTLASATAATTGDKPAKKARATADEKPAMSKKLQRALVAGALAVVVVLGGGYIMYQRYQAKQQRQADIRASLETSRRAMSDGNKNNWQRALSAARQVLALDKKNAEALGLAAQALLAGYLDDGTQHDQRINEAQKHLAAVPAGSGKVPAVERAIALNLIVDGDADAAVTRLKPLADRKDGDAILFLGWAYLAAGQWDEAIASFQASLQATPKRVVPAKFGLARAQLGKGDRAAARASFLEVIALDKEHVGALVGEAESMPSNEFVQQEAALLAILQRKGIENADPRVVARAWTLAGDDARRAGRLDPARGYYRKALALQPAALDTLVSSAALELRDNKLDDAAAAVEKALSLAPNDIAGNLVASELDIKRGALNDAAQRLAALETRTPPLAGAQLGRMHLLQGMRLEADQKLDDALTHYEKASAVLGEDDVEPAIATAMVLGRMAKAARDAKDDEKAAALEARATERLGRLAQAAEQDPALAITLGVAYLTAGSAKESETWLRKALAKRPADIEATSQLAEALRRQGKQDEALATMSKAYDLDPTRIDLGVELARGYEAAGRDPDAASLYKKLVAVPGVSLDVRIRAGRFFARMKDMEATREQADKILDAEPNNSAGSFLRAEGLMADGHLDDARRLFQQAADTDNDPQYQDGLGRVSEALFEKTGDTARRDEALRAYMLASDKDPKMLNPRLGRGRLHLQRSEHAKALAACQEALALAPNEPSIPYCIGMAYAGLNDQPKAVDWLNRAVRIKPSADAYNKLGEIYLDMDGREHEAAGAFTRATELGLEAERDKGVTVPWLTGAYGKLGDVLESKGSHRDACRAYREYLGRNPDAAREAGSITQARTVLLSCH
jgi:tetratricopeptide (TPR) repeat protein